MKGKGDNPIVGSETTDIYDVENHGYKKYNSLEMNDLRAFATRWTVNSYSLGNPSKTLSLSLAGRKSATPSLRSLS